MIGPGARLIDVKRLGAALGIVLGLLLGVAGFAIGAVGLMAVGTTTTTLVVFVRRQLLRPMRVVTSAVVTGEVELTGLVRYAFDRTPPFSASYRRWYRVDLLQEAVDRARGLGEPGAVVGLIARPLDPDNPVVTSTDRVRVATQRYSYRLERSWRDSNGHHRISAHVSDGTTTWSPTYSGFFHARPTVPDDFPARNLLDPSWLTSYDWGIPIPESHNDWDVARLQARQDGLLPRVSHEPSGPDGPIGLRLQPPAEVDVLIDARYGFLHRMAGLVDSEPFVVEELLDIVFDPDIGEGSFRIEPSRVWSPEPPERQG